MVMSHPEIRQEDANPSLQRPPLVDPWHPAWWACSLAVVLTFLAPPGAENAEIAVRWYTLPALLFVLFGCLPSLSGALARHPDEQPTLLPRRVLVVLTILILAGSVVARLWRLTAWPPEGIGFEEYELAARANIGGGPFDRLVHMYANPIEHTLTAYSVSLSFALFDTGFFQMRLPFVVAGVMAPFFFYFACRRLVAWEPALFATALFSVSWWQIAGSRPADEIFFPLFALCAVLWLLLRFEDTAETWAAFALGLSSGLLIYEYSAYHLAAPMVLAHLTVRAALFLLWVRYDLAPWPERRQRLVEATCRYAPGVVVLLVTWFTLGRLQLLRDMRLGMASWLLEGIRRHGTNGVLGRLDTSADFLSFAATRLGDALQALYRPGFNSSDFFFGLGDYPAFDPVTAAAMGAGILLTIVTPLRRFHLFVLLWTTLLVLGAALLPGNTNTHRFYVALPFFYLFIAFGAGVLWNALHWRTARALLLAIFAVAVASAAQANLYRMYWELVPDQGRALNWIWPRTEIARWVRQRPRDELICIIATDEDPGITGPNPLRAEWQWTVKGWNVRVAGAIEGCLPAAMGSTPPRYIIFALRDMPPDLRSVLERAYPGVRELVPIKVPAHRFVGRTFDVPPPRQ
jgi:hypothetical protein